MKLIMILFAMFTMMNVASAQKIGEILKQKAGEGVKEGATISTEQAADKVTDKLLGKIFSGKKNKRKKSKIKEETGDTTATSNNESSNADTAPETGDSPATALQVYSKYDFVPGTKVLVFEDFSQDAIGDFPENWNTNSSGETVTVSGETGHWLMINKRGIFKLEDIKSLPENFTLEYDLIYAGEVPFLQMLFMSAGNGKDGKEVLNADFNYNKRSGVNLGIQPILRDKGGVATIYCYTAGNKIISNNISFQNDGARKIKVSVWRQKQRIRVYIDQNKVLDLPRAFTSGETYNTLMFQTWSEFRNQDKYLIGNIKLAVGDPDTRNKIITEGKFSTTGILFDVNSATIKPESFGTLKDIAGVLQGNPTIHVKIIGHTDSDGDAAANITLSKKRAESVKAALVKEFRIDASRLETDGKGAADPVADNKTAAGKAQNRRVEFVKL